MDRRIPHSAFRIPHSHRGFTLLELLAVMALLALVTATVTVRFSASFRSAQVATAIASIESLDGFLRTLAKKHARPYELRVDLQQQKLTITSAGDLKKEPRRTYALPAPLAIAAVRSPREDRTYGEAVIRCDGTGLCESYAIRMEAPNSSPQWIALAGVTGQSIKKLTDRQVEELFRALRPIGPDAD